MFTILLLLLTAAATVFGGEPIYTLTGLRALQYDLKSGGSGDVQSFGSQMSALRGAVALSSRYTGSWKGVIAAFTTVDGSSIGEQIQRLADAGAAGVLILPTLDASGSSWSSRELDRFLVDNKVSLPVYFIPPSAESNTLVRELLADAVELFATTEKLLKSPTAPLVTAATSVIHGTITSAAGGGAGGKKPTTGQANLLVTSSVDTLGAFPSAATDDLSGTAGLVDLFRIFSKPPTKTPTTTTLEFMLQFLVTNSANLGYAGTKAWIAQRRGEELDSINFVLCLDSLVADDAEKKKNNNKLYLHASKQFAESTVASAILALAVSEGKSRGIDVQLITSKLDPSRTEVGFEHEIFAHKKVPAVTISASPQPAFRQSSTARSPAVPDAAAVTQRVAWLKALVAGALELDGSSFPQPSEQYVAGWLEFGARHSRPFYDNAAPAAVENAFRSKVATTAKSTSGSSWKVVVNATTVTTSTGSITVYTPTEAKLLFYNSKSTAFELGLTVAICAYTVVFAVATVGFSGLRKTLGLKG